MSDERAQVIARWGQRAQAYDAIVRRHALLPDVARRLVELVPAGAAELLDVGGGSGLVSELLLERFPAARVHLCEPAAAMRVLAQRRLGRRLASLQPLAAEELDQDPAPVDAALANACLHLADLPLALGAIAARLSTGGVLIFNLWDHAWAPTTPTPDTGHLWREPLSAALEEAGHGPAQLPAPPARPAPLEPEALGAAASAAGLEVTVLDPDWDEVPAAFFVDFAAMDSGLLAKLPDRAAVFERAHALATGAATLASTRVRCSVP